MKGLHIHHHSSTFYYCFYLFVCRKRKLQLPKKLTKKRAKKEKMKRKCIEYLLSYSMYLFILRIEFVYWFFEFGIINTNDAIRIRKLISISIRLFLVHTQICKMIVFH